MAFLRILAASALGFLVVATTAQAQVTHETKIKHYKIRGQTPLGLVNGMFSKGKKRDGRVLLASLRTKVDYSTKTRQDSCRNWKIDFSARFTMKLPLPRQRHRLPKQTARKFNLFYEFLKTHEETHRKIMLQCLVRLENRANKLLRAARSCADVENASAKFKVIVDEEAIRCKARHDALDRRDEPKLDKTALYKAAKAEARKAGRKAKAVPKVGFDFHKSEFNQGR